MSLAAPASPYPLEAVRQRESWTLESLQSRAAAATVALEQARDRHDTLHRAFRTSAVEFLPGDGSVIEPDQWRRRLRDLARQQAAMTAAADVLAPLDNACDQLRQAVTTQRMRLESIDRHRARYVREATAAQERLLSVEADRDWLARIGWRQHGRGSTPPAVTALHDVPHGDCR